MRLVSAWRPGWLVALSAVVTLAACGGGGGDSTPTEPGAGVVVESEALLPILPQDFCHVKGTVRSTAVTTTLRVFLRWEALDAAGKVIGRTSVVIERLAPGASLGFKATGFLGDKLIPCSAIDSFKRIETTFTKV